MKVQLELSEEELHFLVRMCKRAELSAMAANSLYDFEKDIDKVRDLLVKLRKSGSHDPWAP